MLCILFFCVECVYSGWMRRCDVDGHTNVGAGRGVGCEYMGGTRGSGFVSTDEDVLQMSAVGGVMGVVCEMCMCLTRRRRCGVSWTEVWV